MMLKMVLLPQPDGPIRLTKRPCGIASVTRRERMEDAATRRVLNLMLTSSTQSFGVEDGMRTPADRVEAQNSPIPGNYIAKAMPATMADYVCKRGWADVPSRGMMTVNTPPA